MTADAAESPTRWTTIALEAAVSFGTVAVYLASCALIRVYPVDRLGQISGLASLALRMTLFGFALVVALLVANRVRDGRSFDTTTRLVCAAIAGLASAMVGGGILVALHGTPWGLNGQGGDIGALASWASALQRGESIPPMYPPLSLHVLDQYSRISGLEPGFAIKHLQILGTAVFGPVAYLSWRLLLKPMWALGIGVIAMLPMIEPYKPFPNLVLVVFVPLAILFLGSIRTIADKSNGQLARNSVMYGFGFGVLCLMYSGWFQWAAPGLFVAAIVVFPWRAAPRKALLLLAATGAVFMLIAGHYLIGMFLDPAGKIVDKYVYFDVRTDPMYVAMWRNDTPGAVGMWPPLGELGGVGLFTLLLTAGFGMAVALARKTTIVIGLCALMTGAWIMRFFYAHKLWDTKLVQLYPRTTPLILYCLFVLTGYAVYCLVQRLTIDHPLRGRTGVIGAVCALLLLFGSTGSAISDRYMPSNALPSGPGFLAFNAHRTKWGFEPKVYKALPLHWVRRPSVEP